MVDDPVDDRYRHVVVVEELAPTGKVLVRGQYDRAVLVQAVDQLEQVVPGLPGPLKKYRLLFRHVRSHTDKDKR